MHKKRKKKLINKEEKKLQKEKHWQNNNNNKMKIKKINKHQNDFIRLKLIYIYINNLKNI